MHLFKFFSFRISKIVLNLPYLLLFYIKSWLRKQVECQWPYSSAKTFLSYRILTLGYSWYICLRLKLEVIFKVPNKYCSDYLGSLFHFFPGDMINNDDEANNNHLLNRHHIPDIVLGSLQISSHFILIETS